MKNNLDSIFSIAKNFNESEIKVESVNNGSYITLYFTFNYIKGDLVITEYVRVEISKTTKTLSSEKVDCFCINDWDIYNKDSQLSEMDINLETFANNLTESGLYSISREVHNFKNDLTTREILKNSIILHPDFIKMFGEDLPCSDDVKEENNIALL